MWNIVVRDAQGQEQARKEFREGVITLGRDQDCDVVLPSKAVSRKHARMEAKGRKLFLIDEGSANGCVVDGQRVTTPTEVTEKSAIFIPPFRISVLPVAQPEEDDDATLVIRRPASAGKPAAPAHPQPADAELPELVSLEAPTAPIAPEPVPARTPVPPTAQRPAPAPGVSQEDQDSWSLITSQLDQQIQGIRSHREQADTTAQTRLMQLEESWAKLIGAMQKLRSQLSANPRLRSFDISRDQKDVAVKIEDKREKLGYRYLLLSRHHPDGKFTGMEAVWLREPGKEDKSFPDPQEAASELVQRIAATLA